MYSLEKYSRGQEERIVNSQCKEEDDGVLGAPSPGQDDERENISHDAQHGDGRGGQAVAAPDVTVELKTVRADVEVQGVAVDAGVVSSTVVRPLGERLCHDAVGRQEDQGGFLR